MGEQKENAQTLIEDVTENLRNLEKIMVYLEEKGEDASLFSLIRSNLGSDIDKLMKARESLE